MKAKPAVSRAAKPVEKAAAVKAPKAAVVKKAAAVKAPKAAETKTKAAPAAKQAQAQPNNNETKKNRHTPVLFV